MYLRQSTAQTFRFGQFLDATDGVTEETGLTITPALRRLSKDGAAFAAASGSTNATADSDGWYSAILTTTDTDTVGELILNVQVPATHLPVWMRFYVLEESIYDGLFAASSTYTAQTGDSFARLGAPAGASVSVDIADVPTVAEMNARTLVAANYFDPALDAVANVTLVATTTTNTDMRGTDGVDTAAMRGTDSAALASSFNFTVAGQVDANAQYWNDTVISAALETAIDIRTEMDSNSTRLATLAGGIIEGSTSGTPTTTSTNTDLTGFVTGELVDRVIVFTGGTANGQAAAILTYTSTNGVVTFAALTTAPAASDPFKII